MNKLDVLRWIADNPVESQRAILTTNQTQVLRYVRKKRTFTVKHVREHFDLTISGAWRAVEALKVKGYIREITEGLSLFTNVNQNEKEYKCLI